MVCAEVSFAQLRQRRGDLDLIASKSEAIGSGRAIDVRSMKGRSRGYAVGGRDTMVKSALSIAFHDRCDLIVATAAIESDQAGLQEGDVLRFLSSDLVLR